MSIPFWLLTELPPSISWLSFMFPRLFFEAPFIEAFYIPHGGDPKACWMS
jgi:hypothetical protein